MQRENGAMRPIGRDRVRPRSVSSVHPASAYHPLGGHVIALIGASGQLGPELVRALRGAGAELVLFGRDVGRLRQRFPSLASAVTDQLTQSALTRRFSAVIDLATLNNRAHASLDDFRAVNVARTVALAAESQAAGIPLFISLSSIHAMDPDNDHPYAISKREAREQLLSTAYPAARLLILPKIVTAKRNSARARVWNLIGALKLVALSSDVAEAIIMLIVSDVSNQKEFYVTPLGERVYVFISRIIDVCVALIILVVASWIMLLLGVWVKIQRSW